MKLKWQVSSPREVIIIIINLIIKYVLIFNVINKKNLILVFDIVFRIKIVTNLNIPLLCRYIKIMYKVEVKLNLNNRNMQVINFTYLIHL